MRTTGLPVLALALLLTPSLTAQTVYNATVARTMSLGGYKAPLCPIKGGLPDDRGRRVDQVGAPGIWGRLRSGCKA